MNNINTIKADESKCSIKQLEDYAKKLMKKYYTSKKQKKV